MISTQQMNQKKKTITRLRRQEEKKYKMCEKSYDVGSSLSLKAGKGTPHHNTKDRQGKIKSSGFT
jgi:hypothetical protein